MALQTVRHHVDFAFHEAKRSASTQHEGNRGQPARPAAPEAKTPVYWARKTVVLPIGERWALIALLTALTTPRTTFTVLLVWGLLATAYTTVGRVQRSQAQSAPRTAEAIDA